MPSLLSFIKSLILYSLTNGSSYSVEGGPKHKQPSTYTSDFESPALVPFQEPSLSNFSSSHVNLDVKGRDNVDYGFNRNPSARFGLPLVKDRSRTNRLDQPYGASELEVRRDQSFGRVAFPRISRGRLGRMPITYGKRKAEERESQWSNSLQKESKFNIFARSPMDRMPLSFGKRFKVDKALLRDRDEGNTIFDYLGQRKRFLKNRMQKSFWKGSQSESGDELNTEKRKVYARSPMSRMPLNFGKRSREKPHGNYFNVFARGRMDRMPISFGKRMTNDTKINGIIRIIANSLKNRMRSDENNELDKNHSDAMLNIYARSSMDRMPISFGKRLQDKHNSMVNANIHNSFSSLASKENQDNNFIKPMQWNKWAKRFQRKRKDRLHRMPITFGKRKFDLNAVKRRPPTAKIIQDNDELAKELVRGHYSKFPRTRRAILSRMPLTFGKRLNNDNMFSDGGMNSKIKKWKNDTTEMLIHLLRPLAHLNIPTEETANIEQATNILSAKKWSLTNTPKSKIASDEPTQAAPLSDLYFSDHPINHQHDIFKLDRRSPMNRMPLSFGKRQTYSNGEFDNKPLFGSRQKDLKASKNIIRGLLAIDTVPTQTSKFKAILSPRKKNADYDSREEKGNLGIGNKNLGDIGSIARQSEDWIFDAQRNDGAESVRKNDDDILERTGAFT